MSWDEIKHIYLPELEMEWGNACSALKKTWYALKKGGYTRDLAWRINQIQDAMGIPVTEFEDDDSWGDWEGL